MEKQEVIRRLERMESLQLELQMLQQAMQVLTPEERLVVQMLVIAPERNAADKLCQLLEVERSSVYRRRERALKKLGEVL